jgi:hypothetical protein
MFGVPTSVKERDPTSGDEHRADLDLQIVVELTPEPVSAAPGTREKSQQRVLNRRTHEGAREPSHPRPSLRFDRQRCEKRDGEPRDRADHQACPYADGPVGERHAVGP